MQNLRATIHNRDYDTSKTTGVCGIFRQFGQHDNNDARGTYEIKSKDCNSKRSIQQEAIVSPTHLKFKKETNKVHYLGHSVVWSIALYGA
jgi:hypothetical protein